MPAAALRWTEDDADASPHERPALPPTRPIVTGELPPSVQAAVWRADQLGSPVTAVLPTGFPLLDAELPSGGWPCHAITEILQPQASVAEWRLLGAAARAVVALGRDVVVVGPPKAPHLPGLRQVGLDERRLVWIETETPAERLWVTEQLIKGNAAGLLVAWLPQARPEQIRRLQVCAQGCEKPVFLCRPAHAENEASAAPLRLRLGFAPDWQLRVRILKRKGPVHDGVIELDSVPGGLDAILTPRLRRPSALVAARDNTPAAGIAHAVGSAAPRPAAGRVAAH